MFALAFAMDHQIRKRLALFPENASHSRVELLVFQFPRLITRAVGRAVAKAITRAATRAMAMAVARWFQLPMANHNCQQHRTNLEGEDCRMLGDLSDPEGVITHMDAQ